MLLLSDVTSVLSMFRGVAALQRPVMALNVQGGCSAANTAACCGGVALDKRLCQAAACQTATASRVPCRSALRQHSCRRGPLTPPARCCCAWLPPPSLAGSTSGARLDRPAGAHFFGNVHSAVSLAQVYAT